MSIHYKTRPWNEVIDPAFNKVIQKYLEILRLAEIPSNEGHIILTLPEKSLERLARQGYPKFVKFYEKGTIREATEELQLLFPDAVKDVDFSGITKKIKREQMTIRRIIQDYFLPLARMLQETEGDDYYLKSFKHCKSEESLKAFVSHMSKKEKKNYTRKVLCDLRFIFWRVVISDIGELRKENKYTRELRSNVLNTPKLIRRMLFFIWDTICIMNHKKSLQQLLREARDGNNKLLAALFQYDPTLFDHDWVRERIRKALYSGDVTLINDIGKNLQKGCLDSRKDNLEISIAVMFFWHMGICRLTTRQKMQLLRDSGIEFAQDEHAFRKIVDRIRPFIDKPSVKK